MLREVGRKATFYMLKYVKNNCKGGKIWIKIKDENNNLTTAIKVNVTGEGNLTFAKIVGGYNHYVALKGNGTVWTWGRNNYGQLGLGDTTNRTEPEEVKAERTSEKGTTQEV